MGAGALLKQNACHGNGPKRKVQVIAFVKQDDFHNTLSDVRH